MKKETLERISNENMNILQNKNNYLKSLCIKLTTKYSNLNKK